MPRGRRLEAGLTAACRALCSPAGQEWRNLVAQIDGHRAGHHRLSKFGRHVGALDKRKLAHACRPAAVKACARWFGRRQRLEVQRSPSNSRRRGDRHHRVQRPLYEPARRRVSRRLASVSEPGPTQRRPSSPWVRGESFHFAAKCKRGNGDPPQPEPIRFPPHPRTFS